MKKLLCLALLLSLCTLAAVAQVCVPPPVYDASGAPTGRTAQWPSSIPAGTPVDGLWDAPDYFGCGNYANSPFPVRTCTLPAGKACFGDIECFDATGATGTCTGTPSGGIQKFVDTLPGLGAPGAPFDLVKYIPVANPDIVTYPGSDYYEIAVVEYSHSFHSSLPLTKLRGYIQLNKGTNRACLQAPGGCTAADNTIAPSTVPHYLGPTILAMKDRPVRILFRNQLPTGTDGNLFLPVDTTVMGSGMGPDMMGMMEENLGLVTDGARNPMCGMNPKPASCFTENRATLHLHGGITPWISDGTTHQWITPEGERAYPDHTGTNPSMNPAVNKGVSVVNVPDMPDPGPGAMTFFYTNQQSARLMFYHDHAWGITRLNVYGGEAAGYVLTDPTEQTLMASGALAGLAPYGYPLVIQDRTFIPTDAQLALQDPTWDKTRWGGLGSLWAPHVYMPAQNPDDPTGMSGFGRWMYGPWFWPPATPPYLPIANPYYTSNLAICDPDPAADGWCQPPLIPGTPNQSVGMEHFNDTPIVNGTAYPTITLQPGEYRFRILNAANDRFWNLQWYVADASGTEVALNAAEVAAAQLDPVIFPTPDTTISPPGPAWIQIGTEGGFLPAPVVIPNQVTTWVTDATRFDVGNVDLHSLLLAPAERADVIVDFGPFAGKTLILYNDAPAAFPARVPSYDYYTGAPDLTDGGSAPAIQPGYGPNTRTIMRVIVGTPGSGPGAPPNHVNTARLNALNAAWAHHPDGSGVFESSQDPIIVGQGYDYDDTAGKLVPYNQAYGTTFRGAAPRNGVAKIADSSMTFDTLAINPATNLPYLLTIPFEPKGIHDEMNSATFDIYGRMTANLGFEVYPPTAGGQNITLYPFTNPPVIPNEPGGRWAAVTHHGDTVDPIHLPAGSLQVTKISDQNDGTQIWKITHNGVDTHPLHFHMFNVQLLNRVAWDNRVLMPDPNELGWKDTVRVSPLQDTIVALRPIVPKIPFGVPDSKRPYNPALPLGSTYTQDFWNIDPNGDAIAPGISNDIANFRWEYVWHCHILGHEEMDMMRPLVVNVDRALPAAPSVNAQRSGGTVNLTWLDGTLIDYSQPATWGDPTNEIGFRIERAFVNNTGGVVLPYVGVGSALANQTAFSDTTAGGGSAWSYRVVAYNAAGDSPSAPVIVAPPALALAPTPLVFPDQTVGTTSTAQQVTLLNTGATAVTITTIAYTGDFLDTFNCGGVTTLPATVAGGGTCRINVRFRPTATGLRTGTLIVTANNGDSATAQLSGNGVAPVASVTAPPSMAFGNQAVGSISAPKVVVLQNTGLGTLTINSLTLGGTNSGQFARTTCGATLAPNATCNINVTFQPTSVGAKGPATLTINTNDPVNPAVVVNGLTGTGVLNPLVQPAGPLAFTVTAGSGNPSNTTTITITNVNGTQIRFNTTSAFTIGGTNPTAFAIVPGTCATGAFLQPSQSCTVGVQMNAVGAGATGTRTALLNVRVVAPATTQTVTLNGTITAVAPVVSLNPVTTSGSRYNFGSVTRGQQSAPLLVTVTNTGNANLVFRTGGAGGAFTTSSAQFTFALVPVASGGCSNGMTLVPNASCTVNVRFTPTGGTALGVKTGSLNVYDNAAGSPQRVFLTGTAQ